MTGKLLSITPCLSMSSATVSLIGTQLPLVKLEVGLTFNGSPQPRLWRIGWPRFGISCREAGVVSGWKLVLGAPF